LFAINDWTSKTTEPPLIFGGSFMSLCHWIYNMRIDYPREEILPLDDDVSGAFRWEKYPPNLVAMHSCMQADYLVMNTGGTFGGCTTPSNWEVIAMARQQLARHLWKNDPMIVERARPYLPPIQHATPPTDDEVANFAQAERDSKNPGVHDESGQRLPPQYNHHVDDNIYAEVPEHVDRTLAASIIALYEILGYPSKNVPNAVSQDKLNLRMKFDRKELGYWLDCRALTVGMTPEKRQQLIDMLADWLTRKKFTIREICSLHGMLESVTRYNKWGRAWYAALTNALRLALKQRYHVLKRWYDKQGRTAEFKAALPTSLEHRASAMVSKEMARYLWNSNALIDMPPLVTQCFGVLHHNLLDPKNTWATPIAYIIDRDPHVISLGDASFDGGGGYCETLQFWFDIVWSEKIQRCVRLPHTDPEYVHINCLEFIVIILQLAAVVVRLRTLTPAQQRLFFPNGVPINPIFLSKTDNTTSRAWANKATAKSLVGLALIGVFAELLRTSDIGINCEHIAGILNEIADAISRPTIFNLSHSDRSEQIFRATVCCGLGIISSRVKTSYGSSAPWCSPSRCKFLCPLCQRSWDSSFPSDPLSHVRLFYEVV
jgi:hypothetical protein